MSRRKQAPAQVSSKKRKTVGKDEKKDRPVIISEHEQQIFSVEIGNRIGKWTEEYSEIVDHLPLELQRTFILMKELDQTSEDAKVELNATWKQFCDRRDRSLEDHPCLTSESSAATSKSHLLKIRDKSQLICSLAEEKLALALSAYDTVDRQIRRLDTDLLKNERSLYAGLRKDLESSNSMEFPTSNTPVPKDSDRFSPSGQLLTFWSALVSLDPLVCLEYLKEHMQSNREIPYNVQGHERPRDAKQSSPNKSSDSAVPIEHIDADPSEPKYCYCQRVSYGEMVACDNDDCPCEWFHIGCIGLNHPPKGKWFCQFCAPSNWKGTGVRVPLDAPRRPE